MEQEAAETHQRFLRWVEEAKSVFPLLHDLLDENQRLHAQAAAAAKERERLRDEIYRLSSGIEEFRTVMNRIMALVNEMAPKLRPPRQKGPLGPTPASRAE